MNLELYLNSVRARKAQLAVRIGKNGYRLAYTLALILIVISLSCFSFGKLPRLGYFSLAIALMLLMIVIWYFRDLSRVPVRTPAKSLDDIVTAKLLAILPEKLTPQRAWEAAMSDWPAVFICNHLMIGSSALKALLSDSETDMPAVWAKAIALMQQHNVSELDAGTLLVSLILQSAQIREYLAHHNMHEADVLEVYIWLERTLTYIRLPRPDFGGIGRDWATGFTPSLDRFSHNISRSIELGGGYFHFLSHANVLDSIITDLDHGTAVALVATPGSGKTSLIYGLAERLLEGKDEALRYYQIVSLNASSILSSAGNQLERLMLTLFTESIHSGNIILFLDEAQLFFGQGVGAFDLGQLLLPIAQNHRLKIIASFTPSTWQRLRATNESLAASFAAISLPEPSPADVMKILEDTALNLEHAHNILVTYQAIREAYRLSGQYMQEESYPGKAIKVLEQSIPYASHATLLADSVQKALENSQGVKVSAVQAPEADILLNLEDHIHQRMINQVRAVHVVSAALRRGRAGVSNPKRPVGSFLFLGQTGVGKTELARSLAAIYYGSEHQMIRLDMSEYQRQEDLARLLTAGSQTEHSLIMSIRQQPFSVVLLDEVEKAHPQILNLLLQLLDEGQLTDDNGRPASFRSAIIISTSNAGSAEIAEHVKTSGSIDDFERPLIDKLIAAAIFKPELLNRFDEVVLFRPLNQPELGQVAKLLLDEINKTLANQNIVVELTDSALAIIVRAGYDPQFGARPMRRIMQKTVEDIVAEKILRSEASAGSHILLDAPDVLKILQQQHP